MDRESVINKLVEHIDSALAIDADYVDCVRRDLLQIVVEFLKTDKKLIESQSKLIDMFENKITGIIEETRREWPDETLPLSCNRARERFPDNSGGSEA